MPADATSDAARALSRVRWQNVADRTAATAPGRRALSQRFLDEVDPQRRLPADERERLAAHARSDYFRRIRRMRKSA